MKMLRSPSFPIGGFILVHCGAREESGNIFLDAFPGSKYIGFEPDEEECRRLAKSAKEGYLYFPVAVGLKAETKLLYITRNPSCSSLFPPSQDFADQFLELGSFLEVLRTQSINVVSLDAYLMQHEITSIDFLQLDTQGAELDILQGAENFLSSSVLGIKVEVEFSALYQTQPLFSDIDAWIRKFGFMLFDLDRYRLRRKSDPKGGVKEQVIWGQALYFKDYHELDPQVDRSRLFKLAVLASYYEFHSYALDVLEYMLGDHKKVSGFEGTEIRRVRKEYLKLLQPGFLVRLFFKLNQIRIFHKVFMRLQNLSRKSNTLLNLILAEGRYFSKD